MMSNRDSQAVKILKKYYSGTEIAKEYSLYDSLVNSPKLNESKSEILVSSVLTEVKKLNQEKLTKEKYNLIREIKKHYELDNFFKAKIDAYKVYASVYTLIENQLSSVMNNTKQIITNKLSLLEHITKETLTERKVASKVVEEFMKEDKEIRVLAYRILVEKFNEKYSSLSVEQRDLLKEYINNISDTKKLKTYLNTRLLEVKTEIIGFKETTKDKVLKIKLNEVLNFIKPIAVNESIKDEVLIGLMQYYQLISELKATK